MPALTVIEPEAISADLVPLLEDLLERANAGELSSIAVAFVYRSGVINTAWSTPPCFGTLLGAVARLAHRMNVVKDEE